MTEKKVTGAPEPTKYRYQWKIPKTLAYKRKVNQIVKQGEKTDNYAFVLLQDFQGYKSLLSEVIRIFGLTIERRRCNVFPAYKYRNLRIEMNDSIPLQKLLSVLRFQLSGEFDLNIQFNQRLLSTSMKPFFLNLHFASHEDCWKAFEYLRKSWTTEFPKSRLSFLRTNHYYRMLQRNKDFLIWELSSTELMHQYEKKRLEKEKLEGLRKELEGPVVGEEDDGKGETRSRAAATVAVEAGENEEMLEEGRARGKRGKKVKHSE